VISPAGDVIAESNEIVPRVAMIEGDYRAIARNKGRTYERDFKAIKGVENQIEVLAR